MIDNQDKQTQPLPLDEQPAKCGRGRPATGQALSNAERQRLWRERQKAQRNEKAATGPSWEDVGALTAQIDSMHQELEQAKSRIKELEAQLAQRNEKPSRLNEGMRKMVQDVHEIADAIQGSTWRIQRKARVNGKWATLRGSYWNEAQAEDALAALPYKKGGWWRIIEVKSEVEN